MLLLDQARDRGAGAYAVVLLVVGDRAACAELFGRLRPSASIADAIVLAVYMPAARSGAGTRVLFEIGERRIRQLSRGVLAHRLEHRDDVDGLALERAGQMVPP
jgi:hypothetical protein